MGKLGAELNCRERFRIETGVVAKMQQGVDWQRICIGYRLIAEFIQARRP